MFFNIVHIFQEEMRKNSTNYYQRTRNLLSIMRMILIGQKWNKNNVNKQRSQLQKLQSTVSTDFCLAGFSINLIKIDNSLLKKISKRILISIKPTNIQEWKILPLHCKINHSFAFEQLAQTVAVRGGKIDGI